MHKWRKLSPVGVREVIVKKLVISPTLFEKIKPVHSRFDLSPCGTEAREKILNAGNELFLSRYSSLKFEGILIDTVAAKISTAGYYQFLALEFLRPSLKVDNSRAGEAHMTFGIDSASSLGTTDVDTPVGTITFHITNSVTPFLFCLAGMDNMKVYYNKLIDLLI